MSILSRFKKGSRKGIVICAALMASVLIPQCAMAANPFADVPANHWAYDAVRQLAASGVVSGYPDGAFKGTQPATRYEVASVTARAVANLDMTKVSKHDFEILKKLVMEFSDELVALGIDVDKIDRRVNTLENNIGGWKITGSMVFDANYANEGNLYSDTKNWNRFKDSNITLSKFIDSKNAVVTRFTFDKENTGDKTAVIDRMYLRSDVSPRASFVIGRFDTDWEAEENLYHSGENDGWYNHVTVDGFKFGYNITDKVYAQALIGRNLNMESYPFHVSDHDSAVYALKLDADFSEKFSAGITGAWIRNDNDIVTPFFDTETYSLYAGWNIVPGAALRGVYYIQQNDAADVYTRLYGDSSNAWKVMVDLKQDMLKYTSLWVEYGQLDKGFIGTASNAYNWTDGNRSGVLPVFLNHDSKVLLVRADRKWSDKWNSFLRYSQSKFDESNWDNIRNWTAGVTYQYTPAIAFQLAYDNIDYGNTIRGLGTYDKDTDKVFRFRTTVNF